VVYLHWSVVLNDVFAPHKVLREELEPDISHSYLIEQVELDNKKYTDENRPRNIPLR
jgi:hypothetical protein